MCLIRTSVGSAFSIVPYLVMVALYSLTPNVLRTAVFIFLFDLKFLSTHSHYSYPRQLSMIGNSDRQV